MELAISARNDWTILAGAIVTGAAAAISLVYALSTDQLSVLAYYVIGLSLGSMLTLVIAGPANPLKRKLLFLFLVVYSVNAILMLAFATVLVDSNGLPFISAPIGVIPDDQRFYENGVAVAQAWLRGDAPNLPLSVIKFYGYTYFLGACNLVSSFLGDMSPISPRLINVMAGALLPVMTFRIANLVYSDRRVAYTATLLTAAFPVFSFYSALLLRDMIVAFLISLAVLLFLEGAKRGDAINKGPKLALLVVVIGALYFMRDLSAFVLLVAFATYVYLDQPWWVKLLAAAGGAIALFELASYLDLDAPRAQMYLTYMDRAMDVFVRTEAQDSLGMRYIIGAPFPLNVVLRFPYTAIVPVPPLIAVDLLSLVRGSGALIWYFLFPLWIYGMWLSRHNSEANMLTMVSLLFLLGISLVSIDVRHKTQYFAFAIIQVSYAAHSLGPKTRQVIIGTFLVLGFLAILYGYLRFAG